MKPNSCISRNKNVAWQVVEDKIVVVTPQTRKIHILSGIGSSIWDSIKEPKEMAKIVDIVCEQFDVDRPVAEKDVNEFIDDLSDKEIVTIG